MPNQSTDYLPYLFLAAMIVIGGLVALVADGMGRKIGKKRLSFLGLRPRHTATLITVAAGVLIPILTIAAIFGLSGEVRDWIQKGRGAIEEVKAKTEQVSKLNQQVQKGEDSLKVQKGEVTKLEGKANTLDTKVKAQQKQLESANKQIANAQTNISRLSGSVQAKEALLRKNTAKLNANATRMEALRQERAQMLTNISSLKGNYGTVNRQREEAYAQLDKLNMEIASLEEGSKALTLEKSNLDEQISKSRQDIETYQETIRVQQGEIGKNNIQLDELRGRLADVNKLFGANFESSRTRPMIFEASEEVARVQLPPSLSPVAARNAYLDLLQRARTAALSRKALNSPISASAGLTSRQMGNQMVSVANQEDAIVRGITAQRPELVFIARSFFNAFEGEYVLLEFVAFRNKLVYRDAKVIAEKRIDGRKSDVEVLNQIQDFLSITVRNQALKDGMIPPSGRSGKLGTISEEELFELIKEIQSNNQLVRLQAVAKGDTNAGDQLDILFRVRL